MKPERRSGGFLFPFFQEFQKFNRVLAVIPKTRYENVIF
jgi:hypothetical protein